MMRRWDSLSGAGGLIILFVALFLPGPPPKTEDTAAALVANLLSHRAALVDGVLLAAVGLMALLYFFGSLGAGLNRSDQSGSPLPLAAAIGGVVGVTLMFVGMLLFAGVAFRAASMGDEALVRSVVDTGNMLIETSKYGFAVLILATCASAARSSFLSRRMVVTGVAAGGVLVVSTVPPFLASHGVGQFGGGIDVIGGIPGFIWIVALSVVMVGRRGAACA
jgi:hypothetical protein